MRLTFLKKLLLLSMMLNLISCAYTSKITDKFLPDAEFKTLVVKADAAVHDAEYAKAAELYEKVIIMRPDDLSLKLKQAKAYQSNGILAQAFNSYQIILEAKVPSDAVNNEIKKTAKSNQARLGFKPEVIEAPKEAPAEVLTPATAKEETPPSIEVVQSAEFVKPKEVIPPLVEKTPVREVVPVQETETPPSPMIAQSKAVMAAVAGWSDAWMNKNLELYFSYYVNDFSGQFADAKAWRQSRKTKIINAQQVKIELSDIQFVSRNDDAVDVSFIQHYQSGTYKDSGRKLLSIKKIKGRWLITQEVFK